MFGLISHTARMGACVFVASGSSFDVNGYLRTSPFKAASVFRRGDIPREETVARPDSGFTVIVCEGDIGKQAESAMSFLARHERDLQALRRWGVDDVLFDFGVERTWELQEAHYLPPKLIARMGHLGLGLSFTTVQLPRG